MRSILLVLLFALSTATAQAAPAPTLSKQEARSLPADALKRRVLQQLGDVLVEAPRPSGRRPQRPLTDLWFRTRPHATDLPNVCASESVTVAFDYGGAPNADGDTPAQAVGLEAQPSFFVAQDGRAVRCERLKPFDDRFIFADSAGQAATAVQILRQLTTEPDLYNAIDCDGPCPEALKTLSPNDIFSVTQIPTPPDSAPDERALSIDATPFNLTISYVDIDGHPKIRKARAVEMVVVADSRVD